METHLVDLNRYALPDGDGRFDLHDNDGDVKHVPPITAPPGIVRGLPVVNDNNRTSTRINSIASNGL